MFSVNQSLHRRIFLALSFVAIFSMVALASAAYLTQRNTLRHQFIAELNATVELKQLQITTWLSERRADVAFLGNNEFNRQQLALFLAESATDAAREDAGARLRDTLTSMQFTRSDYSQIVIADPAGKIVLSPNRELVGQYVADRDAVQAIVARSQGALTNESYVQGIVRNPRTGLYEMCFGHVIVGPTTTDSTPPPILGVLLVTTDMSKSIFQMLDTWRMQETGSAVLSHAEEQGTRILNQVRYDPAAPLERLLPYEEAAVAKPAQLAAQGMEDTQLVTDHLGHEVITVFRHIPGVEWGLVFKMDTNEIFAPLHHLLLQVLLIAIPVLAVALAVSGFLARTLTTPIRQLVEATETVAAGDLSIRIVPTASDEIGTLAHSFSHMVANIKEQQIALNKVARENHDLVQQLQAWNQQLEAKVMERTRALEDANAQLTILDEMKTELIYNVSHELRNPITNLKLQLELLCKNGDSPRRTRYIASISRQTELLAQLVNDMLDLMQLDKMRNQVQFCTVNINDVIAAAATKLKPLAQDLALDLTVQYTDEPLVIHGEHQQIQRAIMHLLRNALNFTRLGTVTVHAYRRDNRAYVEIADTGIGIANSDLPYIFQRFYRGANVSQSTIPGSGLGLSLVREVATLHHGDLEVESQLDQGSTFRIWFPISEPTTTYAILTG